jgi:hypothetical protein
MTMMMTLIVMRTMAKRWKKCMCEQCLEQ